jgi:Fe-S cluster assembly ATPase SufC
MLKIDNLHATVDGKAILKGISLTLNPAETHPITEPDGASRRSDSVRFPPIVVVRDRLRGT